MMGKAIRYNMNLSQDDYEALQQLAKKRSTPGLLKVNVSDLIREAIKQLLLKTTKD